MKKSMILTTLFSIFLFLFISCGGDSDNSDTNSTDDSETVDTELIEEEVNDENPDDTDSDVDQSSAFNCVIPKDMLEKVGENYALLQFKGELTEPSPNLPESGEYDYNISIYGNDVTVADEGIFAYWFQGSTRQILNVYSSGNLETVVDGKHFRYNISKLFMFVDDLVPVKEKNSDGGYLKNGATDEQRTFQFLIKVVDDKYDDEGNRYLKECPAYEDKLSNDAAALYVCAGGNTSFAPGEILQVAATVEMGKVEGDCKCTKVSDNSDFDCAEFDKI